MRTIESNSGDRTFNSCLGLNLDQVRQSMGTPTTFSPFSSGYVWQPYEGETYKPLTVSPLLKERMNRLLAA
ncbi:MAG: hypothetical protein AAGD25_26540 [Cyanobacteria bacterium P01_F01_bin.150]